MNFRQLRYVQALAEEGSFLAAAQRCEVSQPALSSGIARLEASLGQRIFERTTRSVALTDYGKIILPSIIDAINAVERMRDLAVPSVPRAQLKVRERRAFPRQITGAELGKSRVR
ncbi:helix-turn-helix domain-containing protein [Hyphomicrobium denitrificans]|mgnify:CR=1 FL=1|uniref:LysR family transcriptional regulator n=1 Tax=Hyphomicrobium denitrificans TaxID=53399 RepID=UPI0002D3324C